VGIYVLVKELFADSFSLCEKEVHGIGKARST